MNSLVRQIRRTWSSQTPSTSAHGPRPWNLSLWTGAALAFLATLYFTSKTNKKKANMLSLAHSDSMAKDNHSPLLSWRAPIVSLDSGSGSSLGSGSGSDLAGQSATAGSVVTPLTCLFLWGNNRYRVADPNSPRLHVPFPTPLFLDSAQWFNEKTAMPESSDLARLHKLYRSRIRSVALSEKHAAAIDGQGDLWQWGMGFFSMAQGDSSVQGQLELQQQEAAASSGLMSLVHHDSTPKPQPPSPSPSLPSSPDSVQPLYPSRPDGSLDFRPVRTLQGMRLTRVAATLDYTFAMNEANELWLCPAVLPATLDADATTRQPVKLTLPLAKDEKLVNMVAGDAHLLLLTDKGSVYSTPTTTNGNFYGQCGLEPSAMSQGPAKRLLETLPSYHAPPSMRDPMQDQLKTRHRGHHVELPPARPLPFLPIARLALDEKVSDLACGSHHSLFLGATSNTVYGCGSNLSCQLGIGFRHHTDAASDKGARDMYALSRPVPLDLMIGTSKESIDPFVGFVAPADQSAAGGHREHYSKYATGSPESTLAGSGGLAPASSHIAHPSELQERLRLVRYPLHSQFSVRKVYAGGLNSGFLTQSRADGQDALFICGQGLQGQYGDGYIRHAQPELGQVKGLGDTKYYDESARALKSISISDVSIGKCHLAASLEAHGVGHILEAQALASKINLPKFGSSLFMWGSNVHYNLGNGRRATSYVPIQPLSFPFVHDDYELYLEKEKSDAEPNPLAPTAFLTLEQLFRLHHHSHHTANVAHDVGLQLFPGLYKQTAAAGENGLEEILPAQKFVCGHDTSAIY